MRKLSHFLALVVVSFACVSASAAAEKTGKRSLVVTATAYNSLSSQTDSSPSVTAWGYQLTPGVKAIAVSRDLLHQYGLKHRDKVRISGMNGEFVVLDKMHARWKKKIDIYMGDDSRKAQRFGRRNVTIKW
ncbi:3D domain-containing protein [Thiolinea disciformis]|uniref:3D domain-containing protein n=1 Tax=Thiolinea disciformis TaxID=125614 RepID=UPI0003823EB4|nr:3D domain-containing protein [Thiolinea disciformis]